MMRFFAILILALKVTALDERITRYKPHVETVLEQDMELCLNTGPYYGDPEVHMLASVYRDSLAYTFRNP
jgi:hypothetical protein